MTIVPVAARQDVTVFYRGDAVDCGSVTVVTDDDIIDLHVRRDRCVAVRDDRDSWCIVYASLIDPPDLTGE